MATMTDRLETRMEQIAEQHGVELSTSTNRCGAVFTSPDWIDWPDEMIAEMRTIARKRGGPHGDYWVEIED